MARSGANNTAKRSFAAGTTQCGILQFEAMDLTTSPIPNFTEIFPPFLHLHLQIIDPLLLRLILVP